MRKPTLSRSLVLSEAYESRDLLLPGPEHAELPERVLQFGTGAFLRGFVDYFIDKANRAGCFNGRVVMVGSTGSGRSRALREQDGLYTLCVQGIEQGKQVDCCQVVAAVSRALSARDEWDEVLACAHNPELSFIVSNTTEVGIVLDEDDRPDLSPPRSFPGKLTMFLYERARTFDYAADKGFIILPCELIEENGARLREIVCTLARRWELGEAFVQWVEAANRFCNTLVDRIVPGTPEGARGRELEERLGYQDALLTAAETYRLWAIEGDEALRQAIPFAAADPGIVVAEDITPFRTRKVRILNGTHTLMIAPAFLSGKDTVVETMQDRLTARFVRRLMLEEIVPSLDMDPAEARAFAGEVLDRLANPFIRHRLLDMAFQATTKLRVRFVPSLCAYVEKEGRVPEAAALGFACFLVFMRGGHRADPAALPEDSRRAYLQQKWDGVAVDDAAGLRRLVDDFLGDETLWHRRLDELPGFAESVAGYLVRVLRDGPRAALSALLEADGDEAPEAAGDGAVQDAALRR